MHRHFGPHPFPPPPLPHQTPTAIAHTFRARHRGVAVFLSAEIGPLLLLLLLVLVQVQVWEALLWMWTHPGGAMCSAVAKAQLPLVRGRGGAVFAAHAANVTVTGCDFSACTADEAAILSLQSVEAYIHGTTFRDSGALWQASGIKVDYFDPASNLTVTNSSFLNLHTGEPNGAEQAGAIAWGGIQSTWEDVYAFNCSDKGPYGGGFFWSLPVTAGDTRSNFTRLHVKGCYAKYGGAFFFYSGGAEFRDSLIEDCQSDYQAGGIYLAPSASRMLFVDTNVTGCSSKTEGGAISSYALDVEFRGGHLHNNSAVQNGGCLYSVPTNGNASLVFDGVTMSNCSCFFKGGAFYQYGGFGANVQTTIMRNSLIENSESINGGGIFAVNGKLLIQNSTLRGCSAAVEGGCLMAMDNTDLTVIDSTFDRCQSLKAGGVAVDQGASVFPRFNTSLVRATFSSNVASGGDGGAAIYCGDSTNSFFLTDNVFVNNEAAAPGASGGAVVMKGALMRITRGNFTSNSASSNGGCAVLENVATIEFDNSTFFNNTAGMAGGAVFVTTQATAVVAGGRFESNSATRGGAIAAEVETQVRVGNCSMRGNTAAETGGAIELIGRARLALTGGRLADNAAAAGGGAIYFAGAASIAVAHAALDNNSASAGRGGGILSDSQGLLIKISDCTFTGNTGSSGGAVYISANASGFVERCSFTDNTATDPEELGGGGDGGALHVVAIQEEPLLRLRQLAFRQNVAGRGGGLFQAYSVPSPRFVNCSDCSNLLGNVATYGAFQATAATQIEVRVVNRTGPVRRLLVTSGEPTPVFEVDLLDYFRNKVTTDTSDLAEVVSPQLFGTLRVVVDNGTFRWQNIISTSSGLDTGAPAGASFLATIKVTSPTGSFPGTLTRSTLIQFCPGGTYQEGQECRRCPVGFYCEAAQPRRVCPKNTFAFAGGAGGVQECAPCGEGLACAEAYFNVTPGYWVNLGKLANASSPEGYQCNLQGCKGASYTLAIPERDDGRQCSAGYSNSRLCARCESNYYQLLGECHYCSPSYRDVWYLLAALVVLAWVALNYISNLFDSVDLMLVETQFLTIIGNFDLSWFAGWINTIMQVFQVSLFNLDFLGPDCVRGSYTYNNRWVFGAIVPLAGIALYAAMFALEEVRIVLHRQLPKWRVLRGSERARASRLRRLVGSASNFLDIIYLDTTIRCFEVFRAVNYDTRVLGADPTVLWRSPTHSRLIPFAALYAVFYVFGFPLVLGIALFVGQRKHLLNTEAFKEAFGWLYDRNEQQWWFMYLPFTVVRRIIFAAILVFLSTSPDLQAILCMVILAVVLCAHYAAQPFRVSSLNVLAGLLLLGQFSFILGGVAVTYMTSTVSGNVAVSLCGAGVVLYIVCFLMVVPYEVHGQWARRWVRRWAKVHSQPEGQAGAVGSKLVKAAAPFLLKLHSSNHRRGGAVDRTVSLRGVGYVDSRLVPLPEVTSWFSPRVMYVFLRDARKEELACLHSVRYHFSYHKPSDVDIESTCVIFQDFPKEMRYAAISQLLSDDPADTIYAESLPLYQNGGGIKEGGPGFDMAADIDPGQRRLVRLRAVAEQMVKERSKEGDSLRVLFDSGKFHLVAAWLIFGSAECRRAFTNLVLAMRRHLCSLPQVPKSLREFDEGGQQQQPGDDSPRLNNEFRAKIRLLMLRHFP
eukprot:jgi/Mesen1/1494/ME000132S00436